MHTKVGVSNLNINILNMEYNVNTLSQKNVTQFQCLILNKVSNN